MEKFKYLRVVFASDGRQNKGIGTRIDKANTVRQERYSSVLTKQKLWKTPKLFFWKSVLFRFSPMVMDYGWWLKYCHLMCKWQRLDLLGSVRGVTLRDKVRSFEFHKSLNVEPLFFHVESPQLQWFGYVYRMPYESLARHMLPAAPTQMQPRDVSSPGGQYGSPILLAPVLLWCQQYYSIWDCFWS